MNVENIKNARTIKIGKRVEYFEKIQSTHIYAKKIAIKEGNDGTIVIAERQTHGIGTKGRAWYTGKNKNIAMTIIVKPLWMIHKTEGLTLNIAKCMKKVINDLYKIDLTIKEPNDLMLNNKKICGILTEVNTIAEKINYVLISIGFNVNEEFFSEDTKIIATSLKKELGRDFDRCEIIVKFIEILEQEIFLAHEK